MTRQITFFEPEDLETLTGLSHDELWKAGFETDDMDFGMLCDTPLDNESEMYTEGPYYDYWLTRNAGAHCVGYDHIQHEGKHWYLLHHA